MLRTFTIEQLEPWLARTYDRSGGPGGQHVNKTSTRATVWFDLEACGLLNDEERGRIRERLASRLSADGRLRVVAQSDRSQVANREEAEMRLLDLLSMALRVQRKRVATKPSRGAKARRLGAKKQRSDAKKLRRDVSRDD